MDRLPGVGEPVVVKCAACDFPNPSGHRFCGNCGMPLTAPPEQALNRPRGYTPAHLAEKILRTGTALRGERKHVTVLFADVKGSLDLARATDPETWHEILDRFFDILTAGVHRFEGTVNQYTGDGIMSLFGAPIAHEDHAQRACHAALHLRTALGDYARRVRRRHGLSFSVRMGLNSGEVVVGTIGDDLRMDYTAIGHTVGLAQRMEELAEPGRVYLTEQTAALVSPWFRTADLGVFDVRGAGTTRVFELEGLGQARTGLDAARVRGFSRFVGRRAEMAVLRSGLEEAERGSGAVVALVGEPGVGKSRLCDELLRLARAAGIKVFEAYAQSYPAASTPSLQGGAGVPFQPVVQLLRAYVGVNEKDGAVAARQKIAGSLLLLDEAFRDDLALVFDLLGVPDPDMPMPAVDPETRIARLRAVLGHLLRARSARGPAVVLLEDLHWLDDRSRSLVGDFVDAVAGTRTLLLVTYRPEPGQDFAERGHLRKVTLLPLDTADAAELVAELLGSDPSVAELAVRIADRTGGNPFFAEEVVRTLAESGALTGERGNFRAAGGLDAAVIPPTVQSTIAARIDRLGETECDVLRVAAVAGRRSSERVIGFVTGLPHAELDAALRSLEEAGFLVRSGDGDGGVSFRHQLMQEIAYSSQLSSSRRPVHAAVARALLELEPDRADEHAPILAFHFEQSGDDLEAAKWHRRAAERSAQDDPYGALRHWRAVRGCLRTLDPSNERDALDLASAISVMNLGARPGLDPTEADQLFRTAVDLAQNKSDTRSEARAWLVYARLRGQAGDIAGAVQHSLRAAELAEKSGWSGLRLAAAVNVSAWHWQLGELVASLEVAERASAAPPSNLRVGAEHLGYSPYIWLVMQRGRLLPWLGRCAEAPEASTRAERLAREQGEEEILCWVHQGHVDGAYLTAEPAAALTHAVQAAEIAERMGTPLLRWSSQYCLGRAHLVRREFTEAVAALEASLGVMRDTRTGLHGEILVRASLAEAHLGTGDVRAALRCAQDALETSRRHPQRPGGISALIFASAALRAHGRTGESLAHALRALDLLSRETTPMLEPYARAELARAAAASGDADVAERERKRARDLFITMGAPARAAELELEKEALHGHR